MPADKLYSVIVAYRMSPEFLDLRPRTRADYSRLIAKIEIEFGDMPIDALNDPRVTADFLRWRDSMTSPRTADYAWSVLTCMLSWARIRGMTSYRPPERIEQRYHSDRSEQIWTKSDIAKFLAVANEPLQHALILALETAQRQGDLLALPWSSYDGQWIRLRQRKTERARKTGRAVAVPVTDRLRAMLDATPRLGPVILTSARGRPWTAGHFRNAWIATARKAGITGLHFHDLRGTAVTRLAEAGCSNAEIAAISGHSLQAVGAILDKYLARTDKLAIAAIAKIRTQRWTE